MEPSTQPGYSVGIGTTNMCGPVPRKPMSRVDGSISAQCASACNELGEDCVGFVVDVAESKCLFRSWESLTGCFERKGAVLDLDSQWSTYIRTSLSKNVAALDLS